MTSANSNPWDQAGPNNPTPQPSPEKPILKPKSKKPNAGGDNPQATGQKRPAKPPLDLTPSTTTAPLPEHLDLWKSSLGWQPSAAQLALFQQLYGQMLAGNRQLNLTRITDPAEFWEKHLWDSLSGMAPWISENAEETEAEGTDGTADEAGTPDAAEGDRPPEDQPEEQPEDQPIQVIDIGTGAGFPGIPAAIALSPIMPIALTL
ncbi:MAG: RsmG family class I SAM-dependent methyltransferase, partial [Cyanobacteria bacterium J06598_3]